MGLKVNFVILLLLITLSITILPYTGSLLASYLEPLSFGYLFIFLANVLVLFFLRVKKSFLFKIQLISTIVSFSWIMDLWNFPKVDKKNNNETIIRLVSWNVDNFQLKSAILTSSSSFLLQKVKPDIVCFQERPHTSLLSWKRIQETLDYNYFVKNAREDEVLNLAVCSKWPLINQKEFYFPDSYNKGIQVDICHPSGIIRLFNVHLQTTGITGDLTFDIFQTIQQNTYIRNQQIQVLLKEIQESPFPVILCGDFNDIPCSYVYHKISPLLLDCFKKAGDGWGGTYQFLGNLYRIDYIFCSHIFQVKDYFLKKNNWSDHAIQCVDLGLPLKNYLR